MLINNICILFLQAGTADQTSEGFAGGLQAPVLFLKWNFAEILFPYQHLDPISGIIIPQIIALVKFSRTAVSIEIPHILYQSQKQLLLISGTNRFLSHLPCFV